MRVWVESWASNRSAALFAKSRVRIDREMSDGWSLYVADDASRIAAMLAFRRRDGYLDQLFVDPAYQRRGIGKMLLQFARTKRPEEIWLRCASLNEKAWRWYEREGFLLEKEEPHKTGWMMRDYRWKKGTSG